MLAYLNFNTILIWHPKALTQKQPFPKLVGQVPILAAITAGGSPNPKDFGAFDRDKTWWRILAPCWKELPAQRPKVGDLVGKITKVRIFVPPCHLA